MSDINFLKRELSVSRQVQFKTGDGKAEIRPPKYGSERVVYLPVGLVDLLSEHIRQHHPDTDSARWLFPALRDPSQPVHVSAVARFWDLARKVVGIDHTVHDLQHFYASGLIASNCSVLTVQRALGHTSASTTLNTYSHLWPNADDQTRRAAGSLLDAALGGTESAAESG